MAWGHDTIAAPGQLSPTDAGLTAPLPRPVPPSPSHSVDKFCAGFDFTLFGTPQMSSILDTREEALKEMGALLENGPKPTVAAVEGACLGGGCELAMACSARVSAKGEQVCKLGQLARFL